jgi:CheY-like chemotaxis protein
MKSEPYVLVVDDDRDIRELVRDILQFEGYSVVTASNGREALEHLRRADLPRLILLDLMMPIMNGWEFRAEQLKDPQLKSIPVVVLTGDGNASEKARSLNAPNYVMKPVHLDHLLALVRSTAGAG